MSTHLLLMLALAGPEPVVTDGRPVAFAVASWSGDELQAACREVVGRSRDVQTFDAPRDVPELVLLRAAVLRSEELSRSERIQARNRIDYCLEKSLERLQRQKARLTKQAADPAGNKVGRNADSHLGGGSGAAVQAQQLISLIEATIQPESWANNGGLGAIRYWAPGYALVIRNTQAVHEEIGGLIGTLEAQQR
jgi:hypothetical protein